MSAICTPASLNIPVLGFAGRAEATSFAVADAAIEGRTAAALEELRWALDGGVAPVLVTSAFAGLRSAAFPSSAKAVVVGAGIVGNSLVHHLARLGWRDLVLLDKGALPNPGGSTGHASNFIFPVDHSKEMTALTRDSTNQYIELGVHTVSGGIEVARTTERLEEFNRRLTSSISARKASGSLLISRSGLS